MRIPLPRPRLAARSPRRGDERGLALPSPVMALSVIVVATAGLAFGVTNGADTRDDVVPVARPADAASPAPAPPPQRVRDAKPVKKKQQEPVVRGETYVVVFNNTNIAGLAGSVAAQASGAGWQVVGSDNWVGTIPAPTVYYPPRLEEAGKLLARDLGIARVMPAVEPMQFDRLTVILTGPL